MSETLADTVGGLAVPARPHDGDCLTWEPVVRAALTRAGHHAAAAFVLGWADPDLRVLAFAHRATLVGDVVVDLTARQFDEDLPDRWIADRDDYCERLAAGARVQAVTVVV